MLNNTTDITMMLGLENQVFESEFKVVQSDYFKWRRIIDLFFSVLIIPFAIPFFVVIAVLLIYEQKGNILYTQMRAGINAKPFKIYKFRTMMDSKFDESNYLYHDANRETKFGKILRKHRLDELPQLFNILLGDMNLIGPRPEAYCQYTYFVSRISDYNKRKLITPGLTGYAQVEYKYCKTFEDTLRRLEYDIYYLENASLLLDIKIISKTILQMLKGTNS